jgi:hypothetical protein
MLLSACLLLTVAGSRQTLRDLIAAEPREMGEAGTRLRAVARPGERVTARTGHVAGTAGLEWEWLPDLPDMPALGRWLAASGVTYVVYGIAEQTFRPRLAALRDPARAPRWLSPVYAAPDGKIALALYRVVPRYLPEPRPGEQFTAPDGSGAGPPAKDAKGREGGRTGAQPFGPRRPHRVAAAMTACPSLSASICVLRGRPRYPSS